ncbi:MAG: arginine repressor [Clostridia bacterium]|nr:arginine repressor [Clostridia bacterium]MDH7572676.1 arginine repressor [Clostridia bacterium]
MAKLGRQRAVLEIISEQVVSTQGQLAFELRKRGYRATQATVSRDIRELGLVKVPAGDGTYRYALPGSASPSADACARMRRLFRDSVVNVDYSDNLVVIRTLPGTAQAVASCVDGVRWPEVLGTVAGDDTILVVIKPRKAVAQAVQKFRELLAEEWPQE